jgi:drug/metabolite transporter (DMT)-like permease
MRSHLLLLTAAAIWGFAFVAQRLGMQHVGPFVFNALRFGLGALLMLPFIRNGTMASAEKGRVPANRVSAMSGGIATGLVLFAGASLQQVGIVFTTAGKAGFITGLYVVLVPLFGIVLGRRTSVSAWLGAFSAVMGLYFLTGIDISGANRGDFLVLASAFFWAFHVLLVGQFSARVGALRLAFMQYATCSLLSLVVAFAIECFVLEQIIGAAIPILYAGLFSVGLAYTLQVVAQRRAHPTHAAIILSLEAVFAVFGGWIILGEIITDRGLLGCLLMLFGMIIAQLDGARERQAP